MEKNVSIKNQECFTLNQTTILKSQMEEYISPLYAANCQ